MTVQVNLVPIYVYLVVVGKLTNQLISYTVTVIHAEFRVKKISTHQLVSVFNGIVYPLLGF